MNISEYHASHTCIHISRGTVDTLQYSYIGIESITPSSAQSHPVASSMFLLVSVSFCSLISIPSRIRNSRHSSRIKTCSAVPP